jgi:hypothetical protein
MSKMPSVSSCNENYKIKLKYDLRCSNGLSNVGHITSVDLFVNKQIVPRAAWLVLAMVGLGAAPAYAASDSASLDRLKASIATQEAKLQQEELQLEQQSLELDQQQSLLDHEMATLRGAGDTDEKRSVQSKPVPEVQSVGAEQQQQQEEEQQRQTTVILQSSTALSGTSGVLTPKGQLVIDPAVEYDYWTQNQLNLNGFTIIPGITLGNIYISRVDQHYLMPSLTARYGLTDRLELNIKLPFVAGFGSTTAQQAGPSAQPLTTSPTAAYIGDVQLGAAYQFNSGANGWPVLVGNLTFKTATGRSPYDVPIYTAQNQSNALLDGLPKQLPTGTGFYALEPSLSVFYPTAPGVIFGNIQYIYNFSRSFTIANPGGGPGSKDRLAPGMAIAATFGLGFALNDKTSMTLSYQEEHVFGASVNGQSLAGSAYDFGTLNFGLGYQLSPRTNLNLGVGIGVGPYAPAAKILIEIPIRFDAL